MSRNALLFIFLIFASTVSAQFIPDVTRLTRGIERKINTIARAAGAGRLKRNPFADADEEEEDDLEEDRFRSGFIPEESPATDTTKIEAPAAAAKEKVPVVPEVLKFEPAEEHEVTPFKPLTSALDSEFSKDSSATSEPAELPDFSPAAREPAHRGVVHFDEGAARDSDPAVSSDEPEIVTVFRGGKNDYCSRFEQHYSFYCVGDVDRTPEGAEVLEKFCPSFKKNCPEKAVGGGNFNTWPANPFSKEIVINKTPKHEATADDPTPELTKHERIKLYMKRRVPCTPECDIKIYAHCTEECKCDYIYPQVQKFCNPPPMPLFLQTCRMWYNKCPKYEGYHYASQYVFSKAEKGKVLPGVVTNPNVVPNPKLTLDGAGNPLRRARAFTSRQTPSRYAPEPEERFHDEPPTPTVTHKHGRRSLLAEAIENSEKEAQNARATVTHEAAAPSSPSSGSSMDAFRKVLHNTYRQKLQREMKEFGGDAVETQPESNRQASNSSRKTRPTTEEEATRSRFKAEVQRDEEPLRKRKPSNYGDFSEALIAPPPIRSTGRAKASQGSIPIIPSDSATAAGDSFKEFDALTDARGIAHRPKTRSPWSKPGLWEPNPDDPHNRDHANKFWYHPDSVTADWLNGQLAWGAHWAVPAAGTGGSDGYSVAHFPSLGNFLNIPDDYD
ncbi:unnamed protein product, partial [Mesorhabditis spiculigera]